MKIKGYENYEIFEDGRIVNSRGRELKTFINNCRYKKITLCKNGKPKTFYLHRLLAIHFIPNPENKYSVDHENRDPLDNSLSNLRWYTREEQMANRGGKYQYPITKGGINKHNGKYYIYQWSEDEIRKWKYCKTLEEAQAYQIEHLKMYHLQIV